MAINQHPLKGSILLCDFNRGFSEPEMVKLRPVIVVSPRIRGRPGLCTVIPLSTTAPETIMPYNTELTIAPQLPAPWNSPTVWLKGDMIYSVSFKRLNLIPLGRNSANKRTYYLSPISGLQMKEVEKCILNSLGLANLTKFV